MCLGFVQTWYGGPSSWRKNSMQNICLPSWRLVSWGLYNWNITVSVSSELMILLHPDYFICHAVVVKCLSYFDVQVSRDDEGDGTRRVELSGSDDAIAEAKELINQILESDDRGGARQSYGIITMEFDWYWSNHCEICLRTWEKKVCG